jgi:dTDP-4-dehydrorhamnose reductase
VRVLVTGAGGLLGGRLASLLRASGVDTCAAYRTAPPPDGLECVSVDLAPEGALSRLLDRTQPDAVVNAAALASVELCRTHPDLAVTVNTLLPGRLAVACRERGLRLVTLSSDLVFAGERAPLAEDAPARPLSLYGRTKLAGEEAVLAAHPSAAVARIALVVGRGHGARPSASESVAWALAAGRRPQLFQDEFRTPVDPESVARALVSLLERGCAGRFHLGGPERLSRYQLGARTARALGLDLAGLLPGSQADREAEEPRPPDVALDSGRAERELAWRPRSLDEALRESRRLPTWTGPAAGS